MYRSVILEPDEVGNALSELNKTGGKVVGVTYIVESQQCLLIIDDNKQKSYFKNEDEIENTE